MTSGDFAGTTLTEMRNQWTIVDVFNAEDHILFLRALEAAAHAKAKRGK